MAEQSVSLSPRRPTADDKTLEADDPYELTGIRYPVAPGDDADRATARTLIEEFALQGWSRASIAELFADPHAGHAHSIYCRRGDALLDQLFDQVFGSTMRTD